MLEILYRIYEVDDTKDFNPTDIVGTCGMFSLSKLNSTELLMDCYVCETREDFKNYIRDIYGKDIKFVYSRKYEPGTIYCIIVGEHAYDSERYFNRVTYDCAYCGAQITTYVNNRDIKIRDYEIKHRLLSDCSDYDKLNFCSHSCKEKFIAQERSKLSDEDLAFDEFITPDSFALGDVVGYIYKISKKSTNEFYVGKTANVPIFRWGQHLKTERFPLNNINDYCFEILETVKAGENLSKREDFWIHECFKQNPDKSLNIQNLQKDRKIIEQTKKFNIKL